VRNVSPRGAFVSCETEDETIAKRGGRPIKVRKPR
jgi:hypothetical protein